MIEAGAELIFVPVVPFALLFWGIFNLFKLGGGGGGGGHAKPHGGGGGHGHGHH